jgi:hypothetical protein
MCLFAVDFRDLQNRISYIKNKIKMSLNRSLHVKNKIKMSLNRSLHVKNKIKMSLNRSLHIKNKIKMSLNRSLHVKNKIKMSLNFFRQFLEGGRFKDKKRPVRNFPKICWKKWKKSPYRHSLKKCVKNGSAQNRTRCMMCVVIKNLLYFVGGVCT